MLKVLVPVLALSAFIGSTRAQGPEVDARIEALRESSHTAGLSIAVIRSGQLEWSRGYGFADPIAGTSAQADTQYCLASLTKPFTATAIMLLIDDGTLSLDDPVSRFLKDSPVAWKNLTIEHLLTHTSGLPDFINDQVVAQNQDASPTHILAEVARHPLLFPPGDRWKYSNTNFLMLGEVLANASGKPWDEFLTARVFRPLSMTSTRRRDPLKQLGFRFDERTKAFAPAWPLRASIFDNADGGLVSSVSDLARFDLALRSMNVLNRSTLARMTGEDGSSPLGWERNEIRGHVRIEHGGLRAGTASQYSHFVDDDFTIIVLANSNACPVKDIVELIAASLNTAYTQPNHMSPCPVPDSAVDQSIRTWLSAIADRNTGSTAIAPGTAKFFIPDHSADMRQLRRSAATLRQLCVDRLPNPCKRNDQHATTVAYYSLTRDNDVIYPIFYLNASGLIVDYDSIRYTNEEERSWFIWAAGGAAAALAVPAVVLIRRRAKKGSIHIRADR